METTATLGNIETPIIATFRDFYNANNVAKELPYVSLVSTHDPTIRFTNSTTSVMKPFLKKPFDGDEIIYLAQPAMGTQGLKYWNDTKKFGPFASYFVSLGAIYPLGLENHLMRDVIALSEMWEYDSGNITLEMHEQDYDLAKVACGELTRIIETNEIDLFRHKYGVGGLTGRNINLMAEDGLGIRQIFGNITKISYHTLPIAWELSFDSTTATSVIRGLRHAVEAHSVSALDQMNDSKIAKVDFETIIAPLFLEGLEPKSRGRGGILRQFLTEYITLSPEMGDGANNVAANILKACQKEIELRKSLGQPAITNNFSYDSAVRVAEKWLLNPDRHRSSGIID